jgi:hypothetical protein
MTNKGRGKFSHHSLQQADKIGLTCGGLVSAWYRSTDWELSKSQKAYKFETYGMESVDDFYTYDDLTETLFTCHDRKDISIIITVTRINGNKKKINDFIKGTHDDNR